MAKKIRFEFNSDGFRAILESGKVKELVGKKGEEIADRANAMLASDKSNGFYTHTAYGFYGGGRHVAYVGTTDIESINAQRRDKILEKAMQQ